MISIIIPSYNSASTIAACLAALHRQTFQGSREIILVDSSIDRTPSIVARLYPDIRYVHLKEKTDPGKARNIGISLSRGGLIAFIDSDCVAAPDWLERINEAHRSPYNVVGGAVINGNQAGDRVAMAGYIAEFREYLPTQPGREVDHVPTCNISYKRSVFERFGLFEGRYYPQEDLVFNRRLRSEGEPILFDPEIRVRHHHRSRLVDFLRHQHRIGVVTAKVLRLIDLEGSRIVRQPFWGILVWPLLPAIKLVRTVNIFMRYLPKAISDRPSVLLIFGTGLLFWAGGFFQGAYSGHLLFKKRGTP